MQARAMHMVTRFDLILFEWMDAPFAINWTMFAISPGLHRLGTGACLEIL